MRDSTFSLHLQVILQRQRLELLIERYGREDDQVLAQSQKVDELIVELQRRLVG